MFSVQKLKNFVKNQQHEYKIGGFNKRLNSEYTTNY